MTEQFKSNYNLGINASAEHIKKRKIARKINEVIKKNKLTQRMVGMLFKIDPHYISDINCYKLDKFSIEKLNEFLKKIKGNK